MSYHRAHALSLAALALLCAVVDFFVPVLGLQVVAGIPLALYLPGAALVLAIDPSGRHVRGVARLMWSCLASLVVLMAGGLILNYVDQLTSKTWAAYLLAVVAIASALTLLRRVYYPLHRGLWSGSLRRRIALGPGPILVLGAAAAIGALAIGLSVYSSATSQQEHFLEFWLVPKPVGAGSTAHRARLGVTNEEGRLESLEVTVTSDGRVLSRYSFRLQPGRSWTHALARRKTVPLVATLALASDPSRVIESVTLAAPVK